MQEISVNEQGKLNEFDPKMVMDRMFEQAVEQKGYLIDEKEGLAGNRQITLRYQFLPNQIEIFDKADKHFQLSSSVKPNEDGEKVISFRVYTAGYQGDSEKRHPLLYATHFVENCFEYYKQTGQSPDLYKAVWAKSGRLKSDFYTQYEKNKAAGMDQKEAALNTREGQVAQGYGFVEPTVSEEGPEVIVYFRR